MEYGKQLGWDNLPHMKLFGGGGRGAELTAVTAYIREDGFARSHAHVLGCTIVDYPIRTQ